MIVEHIKSAGVTKGVERITKSALDDSDVYRAVDDVAIFFVPQPLLQVESGEGLCLPSDGRWIQEAIRHKSRKYDVRLVSQWILVIDGFPYVDDEQVGAFHANPSNRELPFAETWILTVSGVRQLKSG